MIKIKDIAERCNLSIASVSKALSGKTDINPKTIEYVQRVAKEMGYVPNASARMLKTNHSFIIGVLFQDATRSGLKHEYFSEILSSIKDECSKLGYDIIFISDKVAKNECTFLEHARYRHCDGVIIACVDFKNPQVTELVESDIPTITIDYDFNNQSSINSDNVHGITEIINYLVANGHKKIAFIHGEMTAVTQKRVSSFYKACEANGIKVDDKFVREGRYHVPKVSGQITRELIEDVDKPTCIIYPDDYSLLGGYTELEKHGLHIPDDVSVVGYDGIQLAKLSRPEFTTYEQNATEIGVLASRKVVELVENPKTALPERINVVGRLVTGQTVKKIN